MNFKKMISAAVGAGLFVAAHLASAATVTITVDSRDNSTTGGTALDSRIHLDAGELFQLRVDPSQTWNLVGGDPAFNINANGYAGYTSTLWNSDGTSFVAHNGALVGQVGSGHYFTVGTGYTGKADTSGNLKFHVADSDNYNNIGKIDAVFVFPAAVSPVPEPSEAAMASLGLIAVGVASVARGRKQRGAAAV